MAEAGPLDELQGARVDLLRGQVAFASGLGSDAPPLLLKAAARLEPLDLDLARETYLTRGVRRCSPGTWRTRAIWGRSPAPPGLPRARRIRRARSTCCSMAWRCWLPTAGRPRHRCCGRRQPPSPATATPAEERLRWAWLASRPALYLWDADGSLAIAVRATQLARDAGALDQLPIGLQSQANVLTWCGDFPAAAALIEEARLVAEATGTRMAPLRRHVPCCPARPRAARPSR